MRRTSRRLKGIGASPGIAQGRVYIVQQEALAPPQFHLRAHDTEAEVRRFDEAVNNSAMQIRDIRDRMSGADGGEHQLILEAHLLMLSDPILLEGIKKLIRDERVNAEWALARTVERIRTMFDGLSHDYFRERGSDIDFVGERILKNLMGEKPGLSEDELPEDCIVVASDLSPADTVQLGHLKVRGLITEGGSRTSHVAIVARALDIPCVVGVAEIVRHVGTGDQIVVDGFTGEIILQPTRGQLTTAKDTESQKRSREKELIKEALVPARTRDGRLIRVMGNIELPSECEGVISHGGEGIGLYRTEFMYVGRDSAPLEDDHYEQYRQVIESIGYRPVTIRTLDMGGDKLFGSHHTAVERNPALGLRAIRLCLQQPELLRAQVRAILRVGRHAKVKLLIPLVTQVSEIRNVKEMVAEQQESLRKEGTPYAEDLPIGIMVETPATAVIADLLAREVEFFAIGTNDLIQYSLAIDRGNESVAYLYRPLHPAILRLMSTVMEAASQHGISVCLCGEMASEMLYTPVLLGLGLTELSMTSTAVPWIKKMIRDTRIEPCRTLVDQLLMTSSPLEIEEEVRSFIQRHYPDVVGDIY